MRGWPRIRAGRAAVLAGSMMAVAIAAAAGGAWWARGNATSTTFDACERALAQDDPSDALARCRPALRESGLARAGVLLARAHHARGEHEAVLAWATALGDLPEAAEVWRLVADAREAEGDHEGARAARRRALDIALAAGQASAASRDAHLLSSSYWAEADYRQALVHAEIAVAQAERAGARSAQVRALLLLQMVLYEIGDLDGAETTLRMARERVTRDDAETWIYLRFYEGILRKGRGELAAARSAYHDVLTRAPATHPTRRNTYLNLVRLELELDNVDAAAEALEGVMSSRHDTQPGGALRPVSHRHARALVAHARSEHDTAERLLREALAEQPSPDWVGRLHHALGTVLAARGDIVGAAAAYERAIEAIERLRASLGNDELKHWLIAAHRAPYEARFVLAAEHGTAVEALTALERAKARSFLDAFIHASARVPALRDRPLDVERAADRADALRALIPRLGGSPVVAPRPIHEVLEAVRGYHVLLYFEAGGRLWLARAGAVEPAITALGVTPDEVHDAVERLLANPGDRAASEALGAALLPGDALPPPGQPLHIAADGVIGEVPFAALRVRGRYLVETHPVAYVPSMNALAALAQQPQGASGEVLVLGDPAGDLPGAAAEARTVADLLDTRALLGSQADSAALRRGERAPVLHLATHAGMAARGAWLQLSDRRVDTATVLDWRLQPELAVLASCTSAARRGMGMWGSLGAAFLAAGSRAVLASLWSVDDQQARRFLERFYREGGARDPLDALARTQRALAAEGVAPAHWAPYVLLGAGTSRP